MKTLHVFFDGRLPPEVFRVVDRMRAWHGVTQVAVLPDAHLAGDACVGVTIATDGVLYPAAVGADIGCGMASVQLGSDHEIELSDDIGRWLLDRLSEVVPPHRHQSRQPLPLDPRALSTSRLAAIAARDGAVQFATLGRGNHFLELERDELGGLWFTVHTGSRAVGAAVHEHHSRASGLSSSADPGRRYLQDVAWCRSYAAASRRAILDVAASAANEALGVWPDWTTLIDCDHNHVQVEVHSGRHWFVHRKGVTPAATGQPGIVAGSMGTRTVHTVGLGNPDAICSSSHGSGRVMSRTEAHARVGRGDLRRLLQGVIYDQRAEKSLVEEAPSAYRDLRRVMKAQADLTRSIRTLRPLLVYKAL